ncbi:transducin beta-like protein 3 [Culicoides brevitarsis]|uniref:transducin beta-like protein 3 n=1 Tax=Culicoides brevitarsis TaxID=469753 RepID=UPI00307C1414
MIANSKLKEVFEVDKEFGAFYTGGKVAWSKDASKIYCQNVTKINIVDIETVSITSSIGQNVEDEDLEDQIYTFALSPANDFIVSAHKSALLKLWQVEGEVKLKKMWKSLHNGPISQIEFNEDQTLVASGGIDGIIRLWNFDLQVCAATLKGCQGVISAMKFVKSSDGEVEWLVAAGDDHVINAFNLKTGQLEKQFKSHFSTVTDFSFCGEFMVSTGRDKVVILWNFDEIKHIRTIPVYESIETVHILAPSMKLPGGIKVGKTDIFALIGGEEGDLKVWDMNNSKLVYKQENPLLKSAEQKGGLSITDVVYNESSKQIAVVSVDHNIVIHKISSFKCVKQLVGFSDEIIDLVLVGPKDKFIVMASNSPDIKAFDRETMNCKLLKGHTDIVLGLCGYKSWLVSSGKDCSVRVWHIDAENFEFTCVASGTRHTAAVAAVDISRSLDFFASASQDKCIKVWKMVKERAADSSECMLNCINSQLAHEKDINSIKVSPNDKFIATGSQDKTAKLWDARTLELVHVFRGHRRGIWTVQFSPVDQILLTTSADCTIRLWSLSDTTCLKSFEGHESSVLKALFVTDGMQILSTGADGLIKCWNIKNSECVQTLDRHQSRIWAVAVASDETCFYTGGADSMLILWKDVSEEKRIEKITKLQETALEDQQLSNLIHQKKMLKALKLALKLDRPATTLKIINTIIKTREEGLEDTIGSLNEGNKESLLRHAINWNTNGRNTVAAQLVINILLSDVLTKKLNVKGLRNVIEETLPYTERHFNRMTQYLKDIQILNYTLNCTQPHLSEIKMEEESD